METASPRSVSGRDSVSVFSRLEAMEAYAGPLVPAVMDAAGLGERVGALERQMAKGQFPAGDGAALPQSRILADLASAMERIKALETQLQTAGAWLASGPESCVSLSRHLEEVEKLGSRISGLGSRVAAVEEQLADRHETLEEIAGFVAKLEEGGTELRTRLEGVEEEVHLRLPQSDALYDIQSLFEALEERLEERDQRFADRLSAMEELLTFRSESASAPGSGAELPADHGALVDNSTLLSPISELREAMLPRSSVHNSWEANQCVREASSSLPEHEVPVRGRSTGDISLEELCSAHTRHEPRGCSVEEKPEMSRALFTPPPARSVEVPIFLPRPTAAVGVMDTRSPASRRPRSARSASNASRREEEIGEDHGEPAGASATMLPGFPGLQQAPFPTMAQLTPPPPQQRPCVGPHGPYSAGPPMIKASLMMPFNERHSLPSRICQAVQGLAVEQRARARSDAFATPPPASRRKSSDRGSPSPQVQTRSQQAHLIQRTFLPFPRTAQQVQPPPVPQAGSPVWANQRICSPSRAVDEAMLTRTLSQLPAGARSPVQTRRALG